MTTIINVNLGKIVLVIDKLVLYRNNSYVTEEAHIKLMNARTIVRIIIY